MWIVLFNFASVIFWVKGHSATLEITAAVYFIVTLGQFIDWLWPPLLHTSFKVRTFDKDKLSKSYNWRGLYGMLKYSDSLITSRWSELICESPFTLLCYSKIFLFDMAILQMKVSCNARSTVVDCAFVYMLLVARYARIL
jgi:hypothetical protein